jgi:hypothetical protein
MATPTTTTNLIEQYVPYAKYNGGIATALPVYIDSDLTVTGTTNIAGVSLTDLTVTGNTVIGNAASDTLAVTGLSTFTAATTTGVGITLTASALTTGTGLRVVSDSADTSARSLLAIVNDNTAAVGAIPLSVQQDALISTNFKLVAQLAGINIYVSNQNDPNGALTAPEGSLCLNVSATGQIAYNNNGTTGWQTITSA